MKTFNNKGISSVAIAFIVVVIMLGGGLVWWGISRNTNTNTNQNSNTNDNENINRNQNINTNSNINTPTNIDLSSRLDTTNWQKYSNAEISFSFLYPENYAIRNQEGNTIYITKKEYFDRETETPILAISWEETKPNDLEKWIRDKGINDQLFDLPQPLSGKAYQYEYAGNAIHREAYIQLNGNLITLSLGAWFDYDMLDVFNTIMFSLKAE